MKFKAINKNTEFIRGYRKGTSCVTPLFVSYVLKNRYGHTRIGITASKKVGCAVQRNRARRVIREALRSLNLDMSQNYDISLDTGVLGIDQCKDIVVGIVKNSKK